MKKCCCLILAVLIVTGSLFAQKKKVVVETTIGTDVPESLKEIFMSALTTGLSNSGIFELVGNREEYALKIQGELDAQEKGYIDDSQWMAVGHASGAQMVVYAKIAAFDESYFITVNLIDLESGVSHKTLDPIYGARDEIVKKAFELAKQLSGGGMTSSEMDIKPEEKGLPCLSVPGLWIEKRDREMATWRNARGACEGLGQSWRLPTKEEMEAILSAAKRNPASYGEGFKNTTYWTSSMRNATSVYSVDYPSMEITYESITSLAVFRCVRSQ